MRFDLSLSIFTMLTLVGCFQPASDDSTSDGDASGDTTGGTNETGEGQGEAPAGSEAPADDDESGDSTGQGPGGQETTGAVISCQSDADCFEDPAPFCVSGSCVPCGQATAPDQACASLDSSRPVCSNDVCVECTADDTSACGDEICLPDNTCGLCTSHADCPGSACHLDERSLGRQGTCFAEEFVLDVFEGTGAQLNELIADLPPGAQAVIPLADAQYTNVAIELNGDGEYKEVALIGREGSRLVPPNASTRSTVFAGGDALLYLYDLQITAPTSDESVSGVQCGTATSDATTVWLDGTRISGGESGLVVTYGQTHVRRSTIHNNRSGIAIAFAKLVVERSLIADNSEEEIVAGLSTIEISYSSVVHSGSGGVAFECTGSDLGFVRNSIVVGGTEGSFTDECVEDLRLENNVVDRAGLPSSNINAAGVPPSEWFTADYHLITQPEPPALLEGVARWQDGDPIVDIDGDPIPTDANSYPGWDQPSLLGRPTRRPGSTLAGPSCLVSPSPQVSWSEGTQRAGSRATSRLAVVKSTRAERAWPLFSSCSGRHGPPGPPRVPRVS